MIFDINPDRGLGKRSVPEQALRLGNAFKITLLKSLITDKKAGRRSRISTLLVLGLALTIAGCSGGIYIQRPPTSAAKTSEEGNNIIVLPVSGLKDKIKGGWAGQTIGCTYGGDTEFRYQGTFIADYRPIVWQNGKIRYNFENRPDLYDDIYMDLSFLKVMADEGLNASAKQFARAFATADFPLWHANQAARYNILHGLEPPDSGYWKHNPHADDIDFQIEADFIGLVAPGMLRTVAKLGDKVGHIMNYGDGWYGGIFVASMVSLAFVEQDIEVIVRRALQSIPAESTFYQCIRDVIAWHAQYPDDWKRTWFEIQKKWAQDVGCPSGVFDPFDIDAKLNAAYVVTGLLYGNGDFTRTLNITTRCGQDSDSNSATAGGILGIVLGYSRLPDEFLSDIADVEHLPFEYTNLSLHDACRITYDLALQVIRQNRGKTGAGHVEIPLQEPLPVKFEKGWMGHYPHRRMRLGKTLNPTVSLTFHGNGVAVSGYAHKKEAQTPDRVLLVKAIMDKQKAEIIELPTEYRQRRIDLFWKYGLAPGKHELTMEWINPDARFDIKVNHAIIYSQSTPASSVPE